ncbi:MAG: glutathione synthetase [Candidatus Scalindua sp.]|nr:glutathione synthetase [Candidatus Scalindua sp.]MCR4345063.1 glutathione synthetase [Candidatus Scalindua sp.]
MNIGFFVNNVHAEKAVYTTVRLAMTASNRGHHVWFIGASDFTYDPDDTIRAWAKVAPSKKYRATDKYLGALLGEKGHLERISVNDLDILFLRNNPSEENEFRTWARTAGIIFGRMAMCGGVVVLNDPNGLASALDRMYQQLLPESIRPKTLISRNRGKIKSFIKSLGGQGVLKGLKGTGGKSVFVVSTKNQSNLNQMIEAITRTGYVVAQEFLPNAQTGTVRMILMNGEPLRHKGKFAAFQWIRNPDELRSNIHASGITRGVKITDDHLRIAEAVRPRLVEDGMFLAGLDIVDNKLMGLDVFSPGGLGNAQKYEKVNFDEAVIMGLENKVDYMKYYKRQFNNADMASL